MDIFIKRNFAYLGKISHEFYQLPGEFINCEPNEYPDVNGTKSIADVVIRVKMEDGTIQIIDLEDESSKVNDNTLRKIHRYKINISYATKKTCD